MKWRKFITIIGVSSCFVALAITVKNRQEERFSVGPPCSPGKVTPQMASIRGDAVLLAPDGTLWRWGDGMFLKEGMTPKPIRISNDADWRRVSLGPGCILAIKEDGSLWTLGANGALNSGNSNALSEFVRVDDANDWLDISGGMAHVLALKKDGSLWGWGQNDRGQIGNSTKSKQVVSNCRIGTDSDWKTIATGTFNSYALKQDGTLWGWGMGTQQPGSPDDLAPRQLGPETNWIAISAGDFHVAGLRTDGTLWVRGQNAHLISGNSSSPASDFVQIGAGHHWREICSGSDFLLAKDADGSWWGTGRNNSGELGLGTVQPTGIASPLAPLPLDISPWALTAGHGTVVLLNSDGDLWNWGLQLGVKTPPPKFESLREIQNAVFATVFGRRIFRPKGERINVTPYKVGTFRP